MKRKILLLAAATMAALVLVGGAALAATISGTAGNDRLIGTQKADAMKGKAGNDTIIGRGGADTIHAGVGRDVVSGGPHNDTLIIAKDNAVDRASCGRGEGDTVVADRRDVIDGVAAEKAAADVNLVATSCERIEIYVTTTTPEQPSR